MKKFGLVGMPLGHSHSKGLHEALCDHPYDLLAVETPRLKTLLTAPDTHDYHGFNVTIPYKQQVIPFCEALDPLAQRIGSVNTLVRQANGWAGYNTDYDGFLALAKATGIDFSGKRVLIAGTGGTARTVRTAVADQGAKEVYLLSRTAGKPQPQKDGSILAGYDTPAPWQNCDILINTTPVGMFPQGGKMPLDPALLPRLEGILDVVYNPLRTALVWWAKEHGIKAKGGLAMLVGQAVKARSYFDSAEVPAKTSQTVLKHLAATLQNPVLIGMPGSGKTTLGLLLAKELGRAFIDTDQMVCQMAGCSIPEIFEKQGEAAFRQMEAEAIAAATQEKNAVIAVGGGAVLNPENRYLLGSNGLIFYITRPLEALSTQGRPLSKNLDALKQLAQARTPIYEKMADHQMENNGDPTVLAKQMAKIFLEQPLV